MRNKIWFTIGFVFSFWFSFSALNFVLNFAPAQTMLKVAISIPVLPEKSISTVAYTAADLKCLQENIYFEARNQQPIGMAMVGIVTMQRSKLPKFPKTICGVVYEHAQFSWTAHEHKVNLKNSIEAQAWWISGLIAKSILTDDGSLDELYKNVAYYHKTTVHPVWAAKMQREFVLQDHVFYSKAINEAPSFVLR